MYYYGKATLKASESKEVETLIKPCNLSQTISNSNKKQENYSFLYSREFKTVEGKYFRLCDVTLP